jgi:hypothetical protein
LRVQSITAGGKLWRGKTAGIERENDTLVIVFCHFANFLPNLAKDLQPVATSFILSIEIAWNQIYDSLHNPAGFPCKEVACVMLSCEAVQGLPT